MILYTRRLKQDIIFRNKSGIKRKNKYIREENPREKSDKNHL